LSQIRQLDDGELGGSDIESVDVWGQTGKGLLGSIRSDEGVDLDGVNIVQLLQRLLDLSLVGLDINNEDQGVVLLNLLHRALGVERVDDDLVLIEARLRGDGLAEVLGVAGELEGLRLVEGRRGADLADLLRVRALQRRLRSSVGLLAGLALGGGTY